MASIHGPNRINKRADLEDSIKALFGALASAMATSRRPGPTDLTFQPSSVQIPYWRRIDPNAETGRPCRAEIVQAKIAELKRASSPSDPFCFKCSDRGHIAAQCHNATLCFICNRHGHRSSQCRAITSFELPKSGPLLSKNPTDTSPDPPIHPSQLTPPDAGSESGQQYTICCEVPAKDSIKRLETELAEIKQEMTLMEKKRSEMEMAMAGINAQIHRSRSKLAEIEVAKAAQRSAIREEKRCEDEIGISISSINKGNDQMCSEKVVHAIEARRPQESMTEIQRESIKERRHVENLPTSEVTITKLDVNQGVVEDASKETFQGGSLRPRRSLRLRVQGLSA